jgi:hypothetical protein
MKKLIFALLSSIVLISSTAAKADTMDVYFTELLIRGQSETEIIPSFAKVHFELAPNGVITGKITLTQDGFFRFSYIGSYHDDYEPDYLVSFPKPYVGIDPYYYNVPYLGGFYCTDCPREVDFVIGKPGDFTSVMQPYGRANILETPPYRLETRNETYFAQFTSAVPEPGTFDMMFVGLILIGVRRSRKAI